MRKIATVLFIAFSSTAVADNNPPVNISNLTVSSLTMPTASEGESCPGAGAAAYTASGSELGCINGIWLRSSAWNSQQVTSGVSCTNSTGVGSFARGTDGKLYVCR